MIMPDMGSMMVDARVVPVDQGGQPVVDASTQSVDADPVIGDEGMRVADLGVEPPVDGAVGQLDTGT